MLKSISIKDFSLLRDVKIDLNDGLIVLTGESGAGKTLLFDAVTFALGGRPHRSLLAEGAAYCQVELEFELREDDHKRINAPFVAGLNRLIRKYNQNGRGSIKLNEEQVPVSTVQEFADILFEITGQFESRMLFNPQTHMTLLDAFSDSQLKNHLREYRDCYENWRNLNIQLEAVQKSQEQRKQEIDFLGFQVDELEKAVITVGEKVEVESSLKIANNAETIIGASIRASNLLDGDEDNQGAYDLAALATNEIQHVAGLMDGSDNELFDAVQLEQSANTLLEGLRELAGRLRDISQGITHDSNERERLSERMDEILRLERKYNVTADELENLLVEKQARLNLLTDETQSPEALKIKVKETEDMLLKHGSKITGKRKAASVKLEKTATGYFRELDFPHVEMAVEFNELSSPGPDGMEQVEFLISLNPGEPARQLARVASGGEASRLLLGIKAALAGQLKHRVLLLDEVEAGVGGDTGRKVANVLLNLAENSQVIAITHLPVVAARGQSHLLAAKSVKGNQTAVTYSLIGIEERKNELARMLGQVDGKEEAALVEKLLTSG